MSLGKLQIGKVGNLQITLSEQVAAPDSGPVITKRQGEEYRQPEECRGEDDPDQSRAIADVHEVKDDERCFDRGNRQRDDHV